MDSMSAEEALARAKAIAARLSGQFTAEHNTRSSVPAVTTEAAAEATSSTSTLTKSKRKRWGVTPDALSASSGDDSSSKRYKPADVNAVAAALGLTATTTTAAAASSTSPTAPERVTKRVWVATNEERPPSHFVAFLVDKLQPIVQELGGSTSIDDPADQNGDNKQQQQLIQIELQGRGASSEPPPPGMPEQPLHVLIIAPKSMLEQAETKVEILLAQAEEAPVLAPLFSSDDNDSPRAITAEEQNRALMTVGNYSSSGTYRPASVAQLIGQANMPPAALLGTGDLIEEDVQVPNGVVGFIIGRGGENISSMQAKTGCKVQIQKEHELKPGQATRTITLSAVSQAAIDECRDIILHMVREKTAFLSGGSDHPQRRASGGTTGGGGGGSTSIQGKDEQRLQEALAAGHQLVRVPIPDADVGLVIGKMGSTIRSIQDQSGASIQVPPVADAVDAADNQQNGSPPAAPMRTVSITHPTLEGAEHAKQLILNILQSKPSYATGSGGGGGQGQQVTIQVPVPDKDVGLCIGRQGCVIREMQTRTKTRIQIPSQPMPGQTHRIVSVSGTREGCEQVQQMIQAIIAAQSSAPVMSPAGYNNMNINTAGYRAGPGHPHMLAQQQQQQPYAQQQQAANNQQQYSAEWAAYHAAQAAAQQQYATAQQQQYATAAAAQPAVSAAPGTSAAAPASGQPAADAYYEQFFRYAFYYGEEAARTYYGAWSPPVGTPNPYGVNHAGIQPAPTSGAETAPVTAAPAAAPVAAPAPAPAAPAPAPAAPAQEARETGRRKVSNLPAWMTKK